MERQPCISNKRKFQADMITNMIGYPEYIMNNSALEEKYSDLFAEENSYFANSVRFNKVSSDHSIIALSILEFLLYSPLSECFQSP